MKKIVTLAVLGLSSILGVTAACDDGGTAVSCTSDADCANEEVNTVCDPDVLVCVAPAEETCAADADCDLANSASPSVASDCTADADCDEAGGEVCVADGVGTTYCVLADDGVTACADIDATFTTVTVDGVDVCVVDAGESCTDGQCVAE